MRQQQKQDSKQRILTTAARQFRGQGYHATGVSEIMHRSELTNGAFYVHFSSKEELLAEATSEAAKELRDLWTEGLTDLSPAERVLIMLQRYISQSHRDNAEYGCPAPTLGAEISRQGPLVKENFEHQIGTTLQPMIDDLKAMGANDPHGLAWSLISMGVGAVLMSRAINQPSLSDSILETTMEQLKTLLDALTRS